MGGDGCAACRPLLFKHSEKMQFLGIFLCKIRSTFWHPNISPDRSDINALIYKCQSL